MYEKPSVHQIGYEAERTCTDKFALFLFCLCWVGFTFFAVLMVNGSNVDRVFFGTDFAGNVCKDTYPDAPLLWFPIAYSPKTKSFLVSQVTKMGVCVPSCPSKVGDTVSVLGGLRAARGMPSEFTAEYTSEPQFKRCIPHWNTIDCKGDATCERTRSSSKDQFTSAIGLASFMQGGADKLRKSYGIIAVLVLATIVISFFWLVLLRRLVKPIVVSCAIALLIALCLLGAVLFHSHKNAVPGSDTSKLYMTGAIATWVVAGLYLCLLVYLFRDLLLACDIIEEASRVPVDMPSMLIYPVVTAVIVFLTALFFAAIAVAIQTNSHRVDEIASAVFGQAKVTHYSANKGRWAANLLNLFMFLWTMGFFNAICFMSIALCGVMWYWSMPGNCKTPPGDAFFFAPKTVFRYHLGTVALGSLLVALIQWFRAVLRIIEGRLEAIKNAASPARLLLCCANCCLSCSERLVRFLSKNAFVVTAMTGESFMPAARHALHLILNNMKVIAIDWIGEAVIIIGKMLITAFITFLGWLWLRHTDAQGTNLFPLIVIAVLAYFISSVFAAVFSVCIDAVMLCYCYDLEQNNGADKPYYFPDDLRVRIDNAAARQTKKSGKQPPSHKNDNESQQLLDHKV